MAAPPKLPLARTRPVPRRRTTAAGNGGRAQEPVRDPRGDDPASFTRASQRILFLVSAHNSLSQCAYLALTELGHQVAVAVVDSAAAMESAVARHRPQLIVCPMLKTFIPESIWRTNRCLVVHPGPKGDRGVTSSTSAGDRSRR